MTLSCASCQQQFEFVRSRKKPRPPRCCSAVCRAALSSERMARTNRVHASARMKARNPMRNDASRAKMTASLQGRAPAVRGGNGSTAMAEATLSLLLGLPMQVAVKTGMPRDSGYPPCYKLDLADAKRLVGVEVDGSSHRALARKQEDAKKDEFLRRRGWTIVRVSNEEVLADPEAVATRLRTELPW